jgi:hypothetical protein
VRAGTHPCLFEVCGNVAGNRAPGIAAVLVQAKDEAAKAWYLGQAEWLEVPAGVRRALWLLVGGGGITHPTVRYCKCWSASTPFLKLAHCGSKKADALWREQNAARLATLLSGGPNLGG